MNSELNSGRGECSFEALSERLFERSLRFAEIVELSEKCGFGNIENEAKKAFSPPLTFSCRLSSSWPPFHELWSRPSARGAQSPVPWTKGVQEPVR